MLGSRERWQACWNWYREATPGTGWPLLRDLLATFNVAVYCGRTARLLGPSGSKLGEVAPSRCSSTPHAFTVDTLSHLTLHVCMHTMTDESLKTMLLWSDYGAMHASAEE
jgi:hypothetical protein